MCIRDRRQQIVAEAGLGWQAIRAAPDPAAVADGRPPRHRCLLYTSDAADERSSVDLGGRRIIKKKTT